MQAIFDMQHARNLELMGLIQSRIIGKAVTGSWQACYCFSLQASTHMVIRKLTVDMRKLH